MTPRELILYSKQYKDKTKIEDKKNDRRFARICAVIANVNSKKRGGKGFTEDDFIPKEKTEEKKKMSINQMASALKVITLAHGGTIQ